MSRQAGCQTEIFWPMGYYNLAKCTTLAAFDCPRVLQGNRRLTCLLAIWVSCPFGFQLVSRRFPFGMSCPFGRGVQLLLSGLTAATTTILLELDPFVLVLSQ